jgi:hypothetical protein
MNTADKYYRISTASKIVTTNRTHMQGTRYRRNYFTSNRKRRPRRNYDKILFCQCK